MIQGSLQPYCNGLGCPIRSKCCRYKPQDQIDLKKDLNFPFAPYNHQDKKCGFFVGDATDEFLEQLKLTKNGRAKNDTDGEN